jgi:peroxin-5
MADCGASGSALDRAVTAAMGVVTGTANVSTTSQQHEGFMAAATQVLASSLMGANTAVPSEFYGPSTLPGTIVPLALVAPKLEEETNELGVISSSTPGANYTTANRNNSTLPNHHPAVRAAAVPISHHIPSLAQSTYNHYPVAVAQPPFLWAQQQQQQQRIFVEQQKMHYQQQQMHMMHMHMQQQQQHYQLQQQHDSTTTTTTNKLEMAWNDSATDTTNNIISQEDEHLLFDANYDYHYQSSTINDTENADFLSSNSNIAASIEELAQAWKIAEQEDIALHSPSISNYEFSEESHRLVTAAAENVEQTVSGQKNELNTSENNIANKNYMLRGTQHFHEGNISQAIHCFEAELLLPSTDNAVMAWTMLGKCHAENDQDRQAIACLERAIDIDPYCLEALLALGVSYVNECANPRALRTLQAWVQNNPTYASIDISNSTSNTYTSPLEEVKDLLLRALDVVSTTNNDIEEVARVNEALGVCYNVSQEYGTAAGYFERAIELLQQQGSSSSSSSTNKNTMYYTLWNKLGATLANGGISSERALECYVESLRVRPRYARAWLNMAISHSNLRHYEEAARCYLQALSLNPHATHCWSYLRIALTCLERWDLLPLASSQNLEAFHQHFDFISQ